MGKIFLQKYSKPIKITAGSLKGGFRKKSSLHGGTWYARQAEESRWNMTSGDPYEEYERKEVIRMDEK